jgi:hypothetical protein
METNSFSQLLLTALLSSAVVSAIIGVIFQGYRTRMEARVKSQYSWKEQSVTELLAPLNMQFERTERAFDRWNNKNLYLEMKVVKVGNETIRDLLLMKGHLIPPNLRTDAGRLIEHYDVWLEKFEEMRLSKKPDLNTSFVFVGPDGYPFPSDAEKKFRDTFKEYWNDLYGSSVNK